MSYVPSRGAECTGVAAVWCPIHGSCVCPFDTSLGHPGERRTYNDPACPLHSPTSSHAEPHPELAL